MIPTALELLRQGWSPYIEGSARNAPPSAPTKAEEHARDRLLARVQEAVAALKERFSELMAFADFLEALAEANQSHLE